MISEVIEGYFSFQEIHLHDSPTIMTILDGSANIKSDLNCGILVCVGYRHHFEIVSENSGYCVKLHEADTSKKSQTHLITALDLYDGQDTELLLCYNRKFLRFTNLLKHFLIECFCFLLASIRYLPFPEIGRRVKFKCRVRLPLEYITHIDCLCFPVHHCIHIRVNGNSSLS